jgi:hypothetical protein
MGKQVNFYLIPDEIAQLEEKLRALKEPFVIIHNRSSNSEPRILSNLNFIEDDHRWLFYYLVRKDDYASILMRNVPEQNYWVIDNLRSPVIEFNSCFYDGSILRRGRLYYIESYYGIDDELVAKPEPFRKWAKSVLSLTKKNLEKFNNDYIGEKTKHWVKQGGKLLSM